jgi:hypothetical protein
MCSTADWTLIQMLQMPKSRAFTSGEHACCCIISMLKSSNNHHVYSSLASLVPWSLALSILFFCFFIH